MTDACERAEGRKGEKINRVASVRKRAEKKLSGGPLKSRGSAFCSIPLLHSCLLGRQSTKRSSMQGSDRLKQKKSTPAGFEPAPAERRRWVSMIQFILIFRSRPLSHGAVERIYR